MIPYSQFKLTEKQINGIKKNNQRAGIRRYIRKHGVEPSTEMIRSFFSCTNEDIEQYRRASYAKYAMNETENIDDGDDTEPSEDTPRYSITSLESFYDTVSYVDVISGISDGMSHENRNENNDIIEGYRVHSGTEDTLILDY